MYAIMLSLDECPPYKNELLQKSIEHMSLTCKISFANHTKCSFFITKEKEVIKEFDYIFIHKQLEMIDDDLVRMSDLVSFNYCILGVDVEVRYDYYLICLILMHLLGSIPRGTVLSTYNMKRRKNEYYAHVGASK